MTIEQIIYYCLACFVVVIVPGPTVTLIIANTLAFGTRAGILNVVGTQLGLILMIGLLAIGFQFISQQLDWFLVIIRYLGAIYLIWFGYKLFTSRSLVTEITNKKYSHKAIYNPGIFSNLVQPKSFFIFGSIYSAISRFQSINRNSNNFIRSSLYVYWIYF